MLNLPDKRKQLSRGAELHRRARVNSRGNKEIRSLIPNLRIPKTISSARNKQASASGIVTRTPSVDTPVFVSYHNAHSD